ncbi:hypothetical protein PAXRUDRAFT_384291 [Paxillus rubicundulus Ve08.2h10]|uniref:Uncharacterized protein n=1 Tax=Paxillus rubicundulus Ve08.2h10 TaxID=930991 RepID=A0A0D0DDP7_9AGAM|nr:hypothetical protein PAXRUDRAFT_384291 [Paxillus rubicundulus Ve08.2h10]
MDTTSQVVTVPRLTRGMARSVEIRLLDPPEPSVLKLCRGAVHSRCKFHFGQRSSQRVEERAAHTRGTFETWSDILTLLHASPI